jgi:hypothetical protein
LPVKGRCRRDRRGVFRCSPHQHRQRHLRRLPSVQNRLDDVRREQRQPCWSSPALARNVHRKRGRERFIAASVASRRLWYVDGQSNGRLGARSHTGGGNAARSEIHTTAGTKSSALRTNPRSRRPEGGRLRLTPAALRCCSIAASSALPTFWASRTTFEKSFWTFFSSFFNAHPENLTQVR